MSTSKSFWAVIPAAGVGKHMGADRPKQYLELHESTVIEHSLNRLLDMPEISGVVLALDAADEYWPELDFQHHKPVLRVAGGAERCDSVLNALHGLKAHLQDQPGSEAWVLVHDAARPCVRPGDIHQLITAASNDDHGGLLGLPVRDTMKRTPGAFFRESPEGVSLMEETNKREMENHRVQKTVDRTGLWHALTPQMFKLDLLIDALEQARQKGLQVTDDASAMELAGYHPLLVEGHEDNIKITRPFDLKLASLYMKELDHG